MTAQHYLISVSQLNNFFLTTKKEKVKTFEEDYVKGVLKIQGGIDELSSMSEWWVETIFSDKRGQQQRREWRGGFDPLTNEVLTCFGQTGGKFQTTRRKIEENSSGRSVIEQAFMDLKQKYKIKQTKDGFSVAPTTKIEEHIGQTDEVKSLHTEGEQFLSIERPFPMLAKTLDLSKPPSFPVFTQPKTDGVRVLVDFDVDGNMRFSSRARNDFTHLKPVFEKELENVFDSISSLFVNKTPKERIVLDGELSVKAADGADDFQTTISAVKNVKKGLTEKAINDLKIHIFTFFTTLEKTCSLKFEERLEKIAAAKEHCLQNKVLFMETHRAHSVEELKELHAKYVENGSEGLMVYLPSGGYEQNKRSSNLLKYKLFEDAEGKIVGVCAGKGRESKAAMVEVEIKAGVVVTMHPKGSIKEREEWLKTPSKVIGKMMTYTFQGLTDAGIPRFPVAVAIRDYE